MKREEKEEIKTLPAKYKPLGAWAYFGYSILFAIPFIGFICLIVFACSSSNIVRRSYARSFFCGYLIVAIVFIIAAIIIGLNFEAFMQFIQGVLPPEVA